MFSGLENRHCGDAFLKERVLRSVVQGEERGAPTMTARNFKEIKALNDFFFLLCKFVVNNSWFYNRRRKLKLLPKLVHL